MAPNHSEMWETAPVNQAAAGVEIVVEGLARRYGGRWALADVSFHVPPASVMVVGGPNGAGKSTLFRVLATAIRPDRGTATIGGFDVVRHRQDVRRMIALLAHYNYLYDSLTARENLEVFADHMGASRQGITSLLERVGLAARAGDAVSTFSAGMRKRLSFARVLQQEPRVAMLDEPYGALDPAGFELVDTVVDELRRRGTTVLMATHQVDRASRFADQTLMLVQGRLAAPAAGAPATGRPAHRPPAGESALAGDARAAGDPAC
jgi:heme exporter protein A